jgi:hypothetical protein
MTSLKSSNSYLGVASLSILTSAILFAPNLAMSKSPDSANPPIEVSITALPESSFKIDGDSTVRKFSAVAKLFTLGGKARLNRGSTGPLPWTPLEIDMSLQVENLRTGESTLDKHMHESLMAEKYPFIQMHLAAFDFSDPSNGSASVSGNLTVAGVTKPIQLSASVSIEGPNVRIKGKQRLLMSDFGIQPPRMMMGALKTRDEIDVTFDVTFFASANQKD